MNFNNSIHIYNLFYVYFMYQGSNLSRSRRPGASKNKVRDSRIYCPLARAGTWIFFFFFFLGLLYINKRSIIFLIITS